MYIQPNNRTISTDAQPLGQTAMQSSGVQPKLERKAWDVALVVPRVSILQKHAKFIQKRCAASLSKINSQISLTATSMSCNLSSLFLRTRVWIIRRLVNLYQNVDPDRLHALFLLFLVPRLMAGKRRKQESGWCDHMKWNFLVATGEVSHHLSASYISCPRTGKGKKILIDQRSHRMEEMNKESFWTRFNGNSSVGMIDQLKPYSWGS